MYTSSIIYMLTWPALIYVSLLVAKYAVKKYEARIKK